MIRSFVFVAFLFFYFIARAETLEDSHFRFQTTAISQMHDEFSSSYVGKNSFVPIEPSATSYTLTIYLAKRLFRNTEFYINPELAGGSGLSQTLGIAGYPNGEIYRVDTASAKWNLSRLYIQQVFDLGEETEKIDVEYNQLGGQNAVNRLTIVAGHFALNDFLDQNSYSHDPRTQFFNWSLMDYGAWDYGADTRGYTWGLLFDYNQKNWAIRYVVALLPAEANQINFDYQIPNARGDNLELEERFTVAEYKGTIRFLAFSNRAHMGSYRETVGNPVYNSDITKTRDYRTKYGFGVSLEQEMNTDLGIFSRVSWNDGHEESWAFSEIDQSETFGASLKGTRWHRPSDILGSSLMVNHISSDHSAYLNSGGYGFMLGDSRLSYNPEFIWETYYSFEVMKQTFMSLDYSYVMNPAYNSDRGPISIYGFRFHYEI